MTSKEKVDEQLKPFKTALKRGVTSASEFNAFVAWAESIEERLTKLEANAEANGVDDIES